MGCLQFLVGLVKLLLSGSVQPFLGVTKRKFGAIFPPLWKSVRGTAEVGFVPSPPAQGHRESQSGPLASSELNILMQVSVSITSKLAGAVEGITQRLMALQNGRGWAGCENCVAPVTFWVEFKGPILYILDWFGAQ